MSHSAMSTAESAAETACRAGKKPPRNSSCQRCSLRNGFSPTSKGSKCSIVPLTASSRPVRPASPTPWMPSSVSTTTNKWFRSPPHTGYVSMPVIFTRVSRSRRPDDSTRVVCFEQSATTQSPRARLRGFASLERTDRSVGDVLWLLTRAEGYGRRDELWLADGADRPHRSYRGSCLVPLICLNSPLHAV